MDSSKSIEEINKQIKYIESIVSKYVDMFDASNIKELINQIKTKNSDPNLYLAMMGEFSSGKTTTINTLIHDNLLTTDMIQGTTATVTMVRYGENISCDVKYKNGESKYYNPSKTSLIQKIKTFFIGERINYKESLKTYLRAAVATEENSKNITSVTLYYPASILKKNIVLIDTPGTNSLNYRHDTVTKDVLNNMCDAAIIMIDASIPVAESLLKFINDNVLLPIEQCIFVITKIGCVREKERIRQIKHIKNRLQQEFNLSEPLMVIFPPKEIEEENDDTNEAKRSEWQKKCQEAENRIVEIIEEKRIEMQYSRLNLIKKQIISTLLAHLENVRSRCEEKRHILNDSDIPSLDDFLTQQSDKYCPLLGSMIENEVSWLKESMDIIETKYQDIYGCIYNAENKEMLEYALKVNIENVLKDIVMQYDQMLQEYEKHGILKIEEIQEDFEKNFSLLYENLKQLSSNIEPQYNFKSVLTKFPNSVYFNIKNQGNIIHKQNDNDDDKVIFGASGGTLIGQILIPIPLFGAFFGGLIGGWLGSLFGPSLDEKKKECIEKIEPEIVSFADNLDNEFAEKYDKINKYFYDYLYNIFNMYYREYNTAIEKIKVEQKNEENKIKKMENEINSDLDYLTKQAMVG